MLHQHCRVCLQPRLAPGTPQWDSTMEFPSGIQVEFHRVDCHPPHSPLKTVVNMCRMYKPSCGDGSNCKAFGTMCLCTAKKDGLCKGFLKSDKELVCDVGKQPGVLPAPHGFHTLGACPVRAVSWCVDVPGSSCPQIVNACYNKSPTSPQLVMLCSPSTVPLL